MRSYRGRLCDVGENGLRRQVSSVNLSPGVDDREDFRGLEVCEGQVVCRRESNNIAFASHRLGA